MEREAKPPPQTRSSPPSYGGPVPPGGWHRPIPARAVPGELAGWWRRLGASGLDAIVISLPAVLVAAGAVAVVAGPLGGISADGGDDVLAAIAVVLASLILVLGTLVATTLVYAPLTMRRSGARNGQTWGKQLLGIRVVRMGGEPTTFSSAAVREVGAKLLLFVAVGSLLAGIPMLVDALWPLWDDENRALHDLLVDSRVVRV